MVRGFLPPRHITTAAKRTSMSSCAKIKASRSRLSVASAAHQSPAPQPLPHELLLMRAPRP